MKKVILKCKPGKSFGISMAPILCAQGYRVRQDDEKTIEVEPAEGYPLETFFTPDLIEKWEQAGVIVTAET